MSPFPTFCSSSDTDFLEYFVLVYGSEKLSNDEVDFLKVLNQLDSSPVSKIQAIKDFGNNLFRQYQYDQAGACYDTTCRLLCSSLNDKLEFDFTLTISLAVSLCLNLAACANKLQAFEQALVFCSMVLTFFPRNAKALFRKAVALRNLTRFSEACTTLEEASSIEPHNRDIIQALEDVKQSLVFNKNGKRVVVDYLDADEVRAGKMFVSCLYRQEAGMAKKKAKDASCATSRLCSDEERIGGQSMLNPAAAEDYVPVSSLDTPMETMETESSRAPDKPSKDPSVCNFSSSSTSNSHQFHFTNKKRPHNQLHLSCQDYDNLLQGKKLGFYQPRSMSFLRVRTLTSKTIQTGTPHDDSYGTAEVPHYSPAPENSLKSIDVEQPLKSVEQPESVELIQEEAIFEFAAVHNPLLGKEERFVDHCHTKGRKGRAFATLKKRCSVSIDVSTSFGRYTPTTATVMRMKRKDTHLIAFDTHYHPPFKKSRLLSSFATTFTVSSVTCVSTSFGVANTPLCVL